MAEADPSRENPFFHDAFISYSRKDTPFAAAIERALKRYSPPKDLPAPHRRLNIFRDTEDFTGTEYFASVERHLQGSRKLIVICSPNARRSDFVNDEIRRFALSHAAADIISILIAGIPNNEAKSNDQGDMAFPAALVERLEVPLSSDYRNFNPKSDNPASGKNRPAWFKLLADIYGCSRAEVEQREQRRRVRRRIQWTSGGAVIALALGALLYIADYQRRSAKSNELADQAIQLADGDPERAFELARNAVDQRATKLSTSALRVALAKMPDLLIPLSIPAPAGEGDYRGATATGLAPDGRHIAIADAQPRILDLETGRTAVNLEGQGAPISGLLFSPDGVWLAAIDEKHNTIVFDSARGKSTTKITGELHWRQPGAGGAQQAVVLSDKSVQIGDLDNSGSWRPLRELTPRDYVGPTREPYDSSSRELSPDGRRIASLAAQGDADAARLTITDLDSGQAWSRELGSPRPNKLSWSANGSYIVAAALNGFVVLDTRSLHALLHQDSGNEITVEDVSFSADEKLLASTDRNGTTSLWDLETSKIIAKLSGSPTRAYDPIFSSGGLVSVRYADNSVYLFATDHSARASAFVIPSEPMAIFAPIWGGGKTAKFTRDGRTLIIEYEHNKLAFWKTERWRPERRLPLKYEARYSAGKAEGLSDVRITADNSTVGVRNAGAWRGWSVTSGDAVSVNSDLLNPLDKLTLSETAGLQLRNAVSDNTTVSLVDLSSGRQRYPLKHNAPVMSKTFSPDGNCILTTSQFYMASGAPPERADTARLWDTETGILLREWNFGYGNPDTAFFAGRDRFIVLSAGNGFVYRTPLCGSLDELNHLAMPRNSAQVSVDARVDEGLGPKAPPSRPEPPPGPEIPAPAQETPASASVEESPSRPPANSVKETPNAPSFSCASKLSPVEVLICKDAELAKLDVDLAQAYRKKLMDLQGEYRQQLVFEQRAWLKERAGCVNKGDLKQCVEDAFRHRRAALDSRR